MKTRLAHRSSPLARDHDHGGPPTTGGLVTQRLQDSERLLAQRRRLEDAFGGAAQLQVDDEDALQRQADPAQRAADVADAEDDDAPVQGRFDGARPAVAQAREAPNETGLPDPLKSGVEALSGMDLSGVRVHRNSDRPAQLDALAYAQGTDIHLAPGQEQHLPHEAWHVVQQAQGRVQPTMAHPGGTPVNDDRGLEQEADVMGNRAMAGGEAASR